MKPTLAAMPPAWACQTQVLLNFSSAFVGASWSFPVSPTPERNMMTEQLFSLGQMVATPHAIDVLSQDNMTPLDLIKKHVSGDYGQLCAEDAHMNEQAIENGDRILSVYHTSKGEKLYVVTEWDRSATTVLLASEY